VESSRREKFADEARVLNCRVTRHRVKPLQNKGAIVCPNGVRGVQQSPSERLNGYRLRDLKP